MTTGGRDSHRDNQNKGDQLVQGKLDELEASLAPYITEGDTRTDFLQRQIDGFKDKTTRLKTVLRKHRDAERRKRVLQKQNRQNSSQH